LCPIRQIADFTHGQVLEVMVANRLTGARPLYDFESWADQWAVAEIFGVPADKLNDDRLGRTLDAVADHILPIFGSASANAIIEFAIRVNQVHNDATSLMFEGHFAENDPDYPNVTRGYNAEEDYKRKQVRATFSTSADGGIPLMHQTFDGNRTDTTTLMATVESFQGLVRRSGMPTEVLHVGDSKLLAKGNLAKMLALEGVRFVGPLERDKALEQELGELSDADWSEASYASEAEAKRRKTAKPDEWNRFWTQERSWSVKDTQGNDHTIRKIFVRSEEEQRAARKHRERQMGLAEEDLQRLQNGIPRYHKTEEKVTQKAANILRDRRVSGLYRIEVGSVNGRPWISWSVDEGAIEREERLRGHYVLTTNLPVEKSPSDVLAIQKDQWRAEQRFGHWKGPLEVSPIFLKDNKRIAALVFITALALMVYTIIERQVRLQLGDKDGFVKGFLPNRTQVTRPTGPTIFRALEKVSAIVHQHEQRILSVHNVRDNARVLYELFGVTPQSLLGG